MEQIEQLLREYFAGQPVGEVRALAKGWETDVYAFSLAGRPLVLRVYPGQNSASRPAIEAYVMSRLSQAGFPVPVIVGHELERSPFGGPCVIMEQVPGQVMWRHFPGAYMGEEMLPLFCSLLARLHRIDIDHFVGPDRLWQTAADAHSTFELDVLRQIARLADLEEAFDPVFARLKAWETQVNRERRCLIHGDFHSENILIDQAGRIGIIDWSTAAIDDPRVDLAQTYVLEFTQGRPHHAESVRAKYAELSGEPLRDFEFFATLALARRAACVVVSLVGGAHLLGMRPGLEVELRQDLDGIRKGVDLLSHWSGVGLPAVHHILDGIGER